MKLKLAIIGASYLQKPLVLKAKEMGLYTICFAWEEGAVCKDICNEFYPISIIEKEEILKICSKLQIDGIVSIASDIAVITVNYIADKLNIIGNSVESAELSTNKYLMRKAFKRHNISIPKFVIVDQEYDLSTILKLQFPIIVKPVDRSGSKGITVLNSSDGLEHALEVALAVSFRKNAIVEEFISGEEISVESISINGQHSIITFTDKVTSGFPHFVELEHHQPSKYLNSELKETIIDVVSRGLDSLDIRNGASHSELIITKDNLIYLTEIGARMGGDFIGSDLVNLSTGFDYLKSVIDIAMGETLSIELTKSLFSGVYFYTWETRYLKEFILKNDKSIVQYEFDEVHKQELKQSSDRSGYLIYQSSKRLLI